MKQTLRKQGYVVLRLESTLQNFYDRHNELVGWPLRNIHFSDSTVSFLFHVDFFFFPLSSILLPDLTLWVTRYVSYKKQELLTHCEHPRSTALFLWGLSCSFFFSSCLFSFYMSCFSVLCCDFYIICLCSVSFTQYCPCLSIVHS